MRHRARKLRVSPTGRNSRKIKIIAPKQPYQMKLPLPLFQAMTKTEQSEYRVNENLERINKKR